MFRDYILFLSRGPRVQGGQWQETELKKWVRLVTGDLVISVNTLGCPPGSVQWRVTEVVSKR